MPFLGLLLLVAAQLGLPFVVQSQARRQGPSPLPGLDFVMLVALLGQTLLAFALEAVLYAVEGRVVDEGIAYLVLLTAAVTVWTSLLCGWWMGRKLCERADLLERTGMIPLSLIIFSGAFTPLVSAAPLFCVTSALSTGVTLLVVLDLISAR